ncbi:SHOCT-like domain-containing protein [Pseudothermotoga thermarum]|uniref:YvlB/LiaX N-terminal domain-containing protein n=1 Tax=Pseudothermotoga thermarum DSM 5069 TaxID=688269 RepID=F7YWL9_9THEM|nr:hypothetical protein [Pseudothermotoga thermarum]AEH52001.1 hypothetical protein Theth_1961 [Pseudothermotoga thermarum DSM 5069]
MREEFVRVMNLVKEGKLTSEQAAELIETMMSNFASSEKQTHEMSKKLIKVQVRSSKGDNVDIQLPLKLSKLLILGLPALKEKMPDVDLNVISQQLQEALENLENLEGDIVNITASDGTTVRVFVE